MGSEQAAQLEPAANVEVEPEPEIVAPEYDPIPLDCDNPLAEAGIASIEYRLYGVDSFELSGKDKEAVLGMLQNDARTFTEFVGDRYGGFINTVDNLHYTATPHLVVTLDSGEELVVSVYPGNSLYGSRIYFNDHEYEFTDEEYETFAAIYEDCRDEVLDSVDGTLTPYADLTQAHLEKIVRYNTEWDITREGAPEYQELTDEQVGMVVSTLNGLEIDPDAAMYELDALFGGGYEYFELWFKSGAHYYVGSYSGTQWDEETGEPIGSVAYAYIDGVLFECNDDFSESMYWDYEETSWGYKPQFLNARNVPEYPFEEFTTADIEYAQINDDEFYTGRGNLVPHSMYDEIVDVLKQIRYSDENEIEYDSEAMLGRASEAITLTVRLTSVEQVYLGIEEDYSVVNFGRYEQESEVMDAIEDLFDDIRDEYADLIDSTGNHWQSAIKGASGSSEYDETDGQWYPFTEYVIFDLPDILVEHEDGFYPEGYTLEDAPLSVQVYTFDMFGGKRDETKSFVSKLQRDMEAADGVGYVDTDIVTNSGSSILMTHWGDGDEDTELLVMGGYLTHAEIYIKGSDDFEVTPEAVFLLIVDTIDTENVRD